MDMALTPEQEQSFRELYHVVRDTARKLTKGMLPHYDIDDAIQEGSLALVSAIKGYQPASGRTLEKHARLGVWRGIADAWRRLGGRRGSARRAAEIKMVTLDVDTVGYGQQRDNSEYTFAGSIPDYREQDPATAVEEKDHVACLLDRLDPLQEQAMRLYFMHGWLMHEIGTHLHRSESRIHQLIKSGVETLVDAIGERAARKLGLSSVGGGKFAPRRFKEREFHVGSHLVCGSFGLDGDGPDRDAPIKAISS